MRMIIFALLLAISYAQTDRFDILKSSGIRFVEGRVGDEISVGIFEDANAGNVCADNEDKLRSFVGTKAASVRNKVSCSWLKSVLPNNNCDSTIYGSIGNKLMVGVYVYDICAETCGLCGSDPSKSPTFTPLDNVCQIPNNMCINYIELSPATSVDACYAYAKNVPDCFKGGKILNWNAESGECRCSRDSCHSRFRQSSRGFSVYEAECSSQQKELCYQVYGKGYTYKDANYQYEEGVTYDVPMCAEWCNLDSDCWGFFVSSGCWYYTSPPADWAIYNEPFDDSGTSIYGSDTYYMCESVANETATDILCSGVEVFLPVTSEKCPEDNGASLSDCDFDMAFGDLCEADSPLPDGRIDYDIGNCGNHDVFQYTCQPDECEYNEVESHSLCRDYHYLADIYSAKACYDLAKADPYCDAGGKVFSWNSKLGTCYCSRNLCESRIYANDFSTYHASCLNEPNVDDYNDESSMDDYESMADMVNSGGSNSGSPSFPDYEEGSMDNLEMCLGDPATFNAGYGECHTYSPGSSNANYCNMDYDRRTMYFARQVCQECGQCAGSSNEEESSMELDCSACVSEFTMHNLCHCIWEKCDESMIPASCDDSCESEVLQSCTASDTNSVPTTAEPAQDEDYRFVTSGRCHNQHLSSDLTLEECKHFAKSMDLPAPGTNYDMNQPAGCYYDSLQKIVRYMASVCSRSNICICKGGFKDSVKTFDVQEPNRNGDYITLHKFQPLHATIDMDGYRAACVLNGLKVVGCGLDGAPCDSLDESCIPAPSSWGCAAAESKSMISEMNRITDWNFIVAGATGGQYDLRRYPQVSDGPHAYDVVCGSVNYKSMITNFWSYYEKKSGYCSEDGGFFVESVSECTDAHIRTYGWEILATDDGLSSEQSDSHPQGCYFESGSLRFGSKRNVGPCRSDSVCLCKVPTTLHPGSTWPPSRTPSRTPSVNPSYTPSREPSKSPSFRPSLSPSWIIRKNEHRCPNGAGGDFSCIPGMTNQQIALAACRSVYGGMCRTVYCGKFAYYHNGNHRTCTCWGSVYHNGYEFIFENRGHTSVGQDISPGGSNVAGNNLFVRQRLGDCSISPYRIALANFVDLTIGHGSKPPTFLPSISPSLNPSYTEPSQSPSKSIAPTTSSPSLTPSWIQGQMGGMKEYWCNGRSCHIDHEDADWRGGFFRVAIRGDFGDVSEYAIIFINGQKVMNQCLGGYGDCSPTYYNCGSFNAPAGHLQVRVMGSSGVNYCSRNMEVKISWESSFETFYGKSVPTVNPTLYPTVSPTRDPSVSDSDSDESSMDDPIEYSWKLIIEGKNCVEYGKSNNLEEYTDLDIGQCAQHILEEPSERCSHTYFHYKSATSTTGPSCRCVVPGTQCEDGASLVKDSAFNVYKLTSEGDPCYSVYTRGWREGSIFVAEKVNGVLYNVATCAEWCSLNSDCWGFYVFYGCRYWTSPPSETQRYWELPDDTGVSRYGSSTYIMCDSEDPADSQDCPRIYSNSIADSRVADCPCMSFSVDGYSLKDAGCKRCDGSNCAECFAGFKLVYQSGAGVYHSDTYFCVREEFGEVQFQSEKSEVLEEVLLEKPTLNVIMAALAMVGLFAFISTLNKVICKRSEYQPVTEEQEI